MKTLLEMRGIGKAFAGVKAVNDVNFTVRQGEIHALVGENGAGKSTLMKVLSGVYPHGSYEGTIVFDGEERRFRDINDSEALGIISSLKGVGYGSADQPMPIISGQDAEVPSIKAMLRGDQYSTIFKDTRDLAKVTADMVDAALAGKQVTVNDTKTYENGAKTVPSYLLKPVVVYKDNWEKVLVDSGYYKKSQFQ